MRIWLPKQAYSGSHADLLQKQGVGTAPVDFCTRQA